MKLPVFFPVIGNFRSGDEFDQDWLHSQPVRSPPLIPAILRDAAKNAAKWRVFRSVLSSPLTPRRSPARRMGHFWPIVSFRNFGGQRSPSARGYDRAVFPSSNPSASASQSRLRQEYRRPCETPLKMRPNGAFSARSLAHLWPGDGFLRRVWAISGLSSLFAISRVKGHHRPE